MRSLPLALVLSACTASVPLPPDQTEPLREEFSWVDDSRDSPAVGTQPVEEGRAIDVVLWTSPATGEEQVARPLLFFAHGIDGDPTKLDGFGRAVADTGVAVAAIRFPRTNAAAHTGVAGALDLSEQPADMAFALDALTAAVADPDDALFGRFDPTHVTLGGHSLGGATVLLWTRYQADPPDVLGTFLVAPYSAILSTLPGYGEMRPEGPPMLIVQGERDPLVSPSMSQTLMDGTTSPAWFVVLPGVDHASLIEGDDVSVPQLATSISLATAFLAQENGEDGALDPALADAASAGATVQP